MNWNYDASAYNPDKTHSSYTLIPEGNYRCRITDAIEAVTKKAPERPMIVLTLEINGYPDNKPIKDYIVLDPADTKKSNQRIGELFDCFGLPADTSLADIGAAFNGKVGGCKIKHETYFGSDGKEHTGAKVAWLLNKKQQEDLPAWKGAASLASMGFTEISDVDAGELPF